MNIVIITGASSGIGCAFAQRMDLSFDTIDEFWLVARREKQLEELAKNMRHETRVFAMDITDDSELDKLEGAVQKANAKVCMLINCAGYGLVGKFSNVDRKEETGMVRLNCEALTNVTHRMIPYMRRGSRIIQMASCAAFLPQANFAVYAASKAYVLRFSQALGVELRDKGIYVTSVCPGPVDTPFFDVAERYGKTLALKKRTIVPADKVVKQALKDSLRKKSKSVYSLPIQGVALISKLLPHDLILFALRKMGI